MVNVSLPLSPIVAHWFCSGRQRLGAFRRPQQESPPSDGGPDPSSSDRPIEGQQITAALHHRRTGGRGLEREQQIGQASAS